MISSQVAARHDAARLLLDSRRASRPWSGSVFATRISLDWGDRSRGRLKKMKIVPRLLLAAALALPAAPALAQFYKDKTLTLLVNYGVGGNADTEARVYQQHLAKYIPGHPTIIIRNMPGAGGVTAMNQLGLNIGSQPDGL